ncbi:hypothetical protein HSR122_0012 [Halapricum desulfuricans]|uniref:Uncharacterized protein n=1 Tax=Halapricum desulfuricans TaxID=2841257 RepID=A0A897N474_9EURY|nr:hypothetical protein HSR122_0012 [Halapricum desulfuricans]
MGYHTLLRWLRPRIRLINFLNYRRCCSSDPVQRSATTAVVVDFQRFIVRYSS